ncbi:FHA domain-containing protein [bacterium]|nr:FHA domain-containing protein [bacterium]
MSEPNVSSSGTGSEPRGSAAGAFALLDVVRRWNGPEELALEFPVLVSNVEEARAAPWDGMVFSLPRLLARNVAGPRVSPEATQLQIGRGDQNDIVVAQQTVSRRHARFLRNADGVWALVDLGSTNGTWLDDHRLPAGEPAECRRPFSTVGLGSHACGLMERPIFDRYVRGMDKIIEAGSLEWPPRSAGMRDLAASGRTWLHKPGEMTHDEPRASRIIQRIQAAPPHPGRYVVFRDLGIVSEVGSWRELVEDVERAPASIVMIEASPERGRGAVLFRRDEDAESEGRARRVATVRVRRA